MHRLDDLLNARLDVVERTDIHLAGTALAEVGEPEDVVGHLDSFFT